MDNEEIIREHWRVEGTVQGVGFRWGMQQLAKHYRITGWVKNLYKGYTPRFLRRELGM